MVRGATLSVVADRVLRSSVTGFLRALGAGRRQALRFRMARVPAWLTRRSTSLSFRASDWRREQHSFEGAAKWGMAFRGTADQVVRRPALTAGLKEVNGYRSRGLTLSASNDEECRVPSPWSRDLRRLLSA